MVSILSTELSQQPKSKILILGTQELRQHELMNGRMQRMLRLPKSAEQKLDHIQLLMCFLLAVVRNDSEESDSGSFLVCFLLCQQKIKAHLKLLCPFQEIVMVFFSQCVGKILPFEWRLWISLWKSPKTWTWRLEALQLRYPFTGPRWRSSLFVIPLPLLFSFPLSSLSYTNF